MSVGRTHGLNRSSLAALAGASVLVLSWGASCKKERSAPVDDGTVLTPYLAIGDTLAHDRIEGLPELAASVIQAAERREGEPGIDKLVQGASRVGSPDIATARAAFRTMSLGMIEHVRSNPDQQEGRSLVHCTMTFHGDGGLWVQNSGKVMNPYEGAMMLHCGDILDWSDPLPE